jgi:NAD(P)-dependent dehydrogenase (short-subunit alcohol dehydrogenase family)
MRQDAFANKVAVITGGASGIGAAIGRAMARRGAEVILADRQVDAAEEEAAVIRAGGGRASAVEVDVRHLTSVKNVVEKTVDRTDRIDYFFNNAGISVGGEAHTYEPRDWDDVLDVNLRGVTNGVQAVYPLLVRQRSGHIVNTSSVAGLLPIAAQLSYTASKHAIVGLSRALRVEAKRHGVRVSVLCPGIIRTPILMGGKFGRLNVTGLTADTALRLVEQTRPMDPCVFAQKALAAIARNEAIIVIPAWWNLLWFVDRLSPSLAMRLSELALDQMRARFEQLGVGARPSSARPRLRAVE